MGIFGNSKIKNELVVVFDIGSSTVGGALFYVNKNESPKIIFSFREPIVLQEKIDFEQFLASTLKSLEVVANRVCMTGLGSPKKIFCVLSSVWYASQTRHIKFSKNTEFLFTEKLADSLIQKEIVLFEEDHLKKNTNSNEKVRPIELKNMKTTLNGYANDKPIGQKTKELEMTIFISMSPENVLNKIEESINRHFNSQEIKFSSFAMSAFTVARDMFVQQDNFLLVDIGGEITDVSMAKKDILRESISYPIGRNFFIRSIANETNCSLDEGRTCIAMYKDGHMEDLVHKKIEPVIEKLKKDWLKNFQEVLVNLSNDISIPSNIFLTVDKDMAEFFADTIKNEQFNQYTLTESKFKVSFLSTETLHGLATFKEDVIRDPFLIIESIYINRFLI